MTTPARVARKVSKRTRFEVLKRDGFRCRYCGVTPERSTLHVDHVVAIANGGTNAMENLVSSCEPCNAGKAAVMIDLKASKTIPSARAIREQAEQVQAYLTAVRDLESSRSELAGMFLDRWVEIFGSPTKRFASRLRNLSGTVDPQTVFDAIDITSRQLRIDNEEHYFNGVLRNLCKMEEGNGTHPHD